MKNNAPKLTLKTLSKRPARLRISGIALLCLIAYGLRVWELGRIELSFDEVATVFIARRTPLEIIRYVMGAIREHPPLYYLGMSLWFRVAGMSEFAIRYPSVLAGVLGVAWCGRLGHRFYGKPGRWWCSLILALMPISLWAARTGRMYALILLLAMITIETWLNWLEQPSWQRWAIFMGLSIIGAMTHYFLVLMWAVEGVVLLLAPRKTAKIRWAWLGTVGVGGIVLLIFMLISPGIRETLIRTLGLFPLREIRIEQMRLLITELYVYYRDSTRFTVAGIALGLTLLGWARLWRKKPLYGALLMAWGLVPIIVMNFVPVDLNARYLIMTVPALACGLAALVSLIRPPIARGLMLALVLISASHPQVRMTWNEVYHPLEGTFSTQVDVLHAAACPGDAIVLNGPWPSLLFEYYVPPDDVWVYRVPQAAPPGFDRAVDVPRLKRIAAQHPRIWTFYSAIRPADPTYAVSRWFAENTYAIHQHKSMVLYLPAADTMIPLASDIDFGASLQLRQAAVDQTTVNIGDPLRVKLVWDSDHTHTDPLLTLALMDKSGTIWSPTEFWMGPVHRLLDQPIPEHAGDGTWTDRRGIWLLPGTPPGNYTLVLHVEAQGITQPGINIDRWTPLGEVQISAAPPTYARDDCAPQLQDVLAQWANAHITFGDKLALVGLEPLDTSVMQGYPVKLNLWWEVLERAGEAHLRLRLTGRKNVEIGEFPLGPDFYPSAQWQVGDIVQQQVNFTLPEDLPGGTYHIQLQVITQGGQIQKAQGSRDPLIFGEQWMQIFRPGSQIPIQGVWADALTLTSEEQDRSYRPPLFRNRSDVRFGDVLRLRGHTIGQTELSVGESTELVVYWQALRRPQEIYAVFNHLRGPDNQMLWQQDSWPQGGTYTTNHWLTGEVVEEHYNLTIAENTPPGTYPLYIGVYNAATGDRLPATTPQGERIPNDQIVLLNINVVQ